MREFIKWIRKYNVELIAGIMSLRKFLRYADVRIRTLIPPVVFSGAASLLTACVFGIFLLPLSRGLISYDFAFVRNIIIFKPFARAFPDLFSSQMFLMVIALVATYVLLISKNIFAYLSAVSTNNISIKVSSRIRKLISRRHLSFGKAYFDNTSSSRVSLDVMQFTNSVAGQVRSFHSMFFYILHAVSMFGVMFCVSMPLTLLAVVAAVVVVVVINRFSRDISQSARSHTSAQAKLGQNIMNLILNIPVVKSYGREDIEARRFAEISDQEIVAGMQISQRTQMLGPVDDVVSWTALLLISAVIGFLVSRNTAFKVVNTFVFLMLVRQFIDSIGELFKQSLKVAQKRGEVDSLERVLDDEGKNIVPSGTREFSGLQDLIEIKGLDFSYGGKNQILKGISFTIHKGKTTAIVGSTGSGKSTILNLLMRFYDCPGGTIFVDGIDIREYSITSLMLRITLVSQDVLLFDDTIRNNITYGVEGVSDDALIELLKKLNFYKFVMSNPKNLDMVVGERGAKLSGGQKQLLSIARALVKGFDILILDEATSYLDLKTESMVLKVIGEYAKDKTVIVIAHRLSSVRHADKVVVLEDGMFVEDGNIAELIEKKGTFYEYVVLHQITW